MEWGKFLAETAKVVFSGIAGVVLTLLFSPQISEETIIKLWAKESELISENMTLNEAKQAFLNEIKEKENEIINLNSILNKTNTENIELKSAIDIVNNEYDSIRIKNAKAFAQKGDYENALKQLNETTSNSPEIDMLIDEYSNQFILKCIEMTDAYVDADNFQAALEHIENSLILLPENEILLQLLNETQSKKPKKLSDIGIGDYNNLSSYNDSYVYDTTGKKHSGENVYTISADNDNSGYIRVYLGKEYTRVKGYIAVSDNSAVGRPLSGNIEINLDGEQCEYYEVPDRAITPIEFSVSVENIDWFEIKYNGSYFSSAYGYESFEIVISDVYLYK